MSERFQLPIPMWRAQFQILGGARRALIVVVVQVALLVAATAFFGGLFARYGFARVATVMVNVMLGIQAALLVLHGCNAIHRVLLRDYQTRMFESHRLTPMSNHAVVLGYLIGGGGHPLMMFGVNLVFGTILSFLGQQPPGLWLCGNAMFLAGALPLWALMILVGLRPGKPVSPAVILLTAGLLGGPFFMVLPLAGLMTSLFSMVLGFAVGVGNVSAGDPGLPLCAVASLFLAGFWLHLAALKYRRPDLPVLNGYRGLFLLLVCLGLGVGGVLAVGRSGTGPWNTPGEGAELLGTAWLLTFGAALSAALIPIAGCAATRRLAREGRALRDRSDRLSSLAAALTAGVLIAATLVVLRLTLWDSRVMVRPNEDWRVLGCAVLACVFALLTARGLWVILQPKTATADTLLVLLVAALWAPPLAVDAFLVAAFNRSWSLLAGCSPFGPLYALWQPEMSAPLWPGLLIQATVALLLTWLAHRAERNRLARTDRAASAMPPAAPGIRG